MKSFTTIGLLLSLAAIYASGQLRTSGLFGFLSEEPSVPDFVVSFEHTTSAATISANSSKLDHPSLNGNADAILIVAPIGDALTKNYNAIGVWYDGSTWLIFNQNRVSMPVGVTYRVTVYRSEEKTVFIHRADAQNTNGSQTTIQHPQLMNKPKAAVNVTQNWNPGGQGGIYNDSSVVAERQGSVWAIRNMNGNPIPTGAAFNVVVIPEGQVDLITAITADNKNYIPPKVDPNSVNSSGVPNVGVARPIRKPPVNDVDFTNWGFEKGSEGWYFDGDGDAFVGQPVWGNNVVSERVLANMNYANGGIGGDYWKKIPYPIGIKGNYWIGTYEQQGLMDGPVGPTQGDAPVGILASEDIVITKRWVEFLLGGGSDRTKLRVELQIKQPDGTYQTALTRTNFRNSELMFRENISLGEFAGKTARIRIVDQATGGWGHINVDDFRFVDELSPGITLTEGGVRYKIDADREIWGFADTHAHWMNHVGLNGLMHGVPGGNWRTSNVRRDIPQCDGFNHGLPTITPGMLIAMTETAALDRFRERLGDPGNAICFGLTGLTSIPAAAVSLGMLGIGGREAAIFTGLYTSAPNPFFQACGYQFTKDVFAKHYNNAVPEDRYDVSNYVDYPRWNTFSHQLMHVTWVRRSFEGGQRLMVVPVGTAKSWEFNTTSDGRMAPAKAHIENAVGALKRLVSENSDWLEIALTPQDTRRIILQGKMAIVIGLEQAEVGNYGFPSAAEEVAWLHGLGMRHIYPIHNIDNRIGGAGVFNSAIKSYNDLVNRESQDSPIVSFNIRRGNDGPPNEHTSFALRRGFMRQGMRLVPIFGFGTIPFFYLNDVPEEFGYDQTFPHKNAKGLTTYGETYVSELMRRGMVIDVDHMSDLSQERVMQMLAAKRYPMVSGHTNFRDLRWVTGNTENEAKQKTEFTIHDRRAREINAAGGMFALMTQQNQVHDVRDCPVRNDSAGSSKSFSQAYCYALQKTGGKRGIGFGSDFNGFAPQTAPRFGVDAGIMLEGDDRMNFRQGERGEDRLRRTLAFMQTDGVRYDTPIRTYHYHRFQKPPFLTSEEREVWEGLAIAKSGTPADDAWQPPGVYERTVFQRDKIKNFAKGFRTRPTGSFLDYLDCPEYAIKALNDCMPERKAAFMSVNGEASLPASVKDERTMELFRVVKPIYDLWMQFENGPNEPLRRSFAYPGGRDFDFNLDGLAHYGMFPDMIQDMKNTGLNSTQLTPLFMGAEEYIRMWEKADRAKND